ncbi:hypothetical protein WP50_07025 [Lactiplantibacillus plantarum]|nr:hypothetical protein WP50_07025 [Lactiplantibacillus plantarum]
MRVALASATWNDAEQAQLQAVPDDQKIPLLRAFVTTRQSVFDQAQQTTSKINRSVKAARNFIQTLLRNLKRSIKPPARLVISLSPICGSH